jgi:hypothetical protein
MFGIVSRRSGKPNFVASLDEQRLHVTNLSENCHEFFNANLRLAQNALQSFRRKGVMCGHGYTKRTPKKANM